MAFRPLTDANCGAPNPLVQLTSHLTRDHAHQEQHGQAFPGSSDQLVEQFLQETRAVPQTFHMNDLMREIHDMESQRANLPPVPSASVKEHLNDDMWALQYIQDGMHFNVQQQDHDAIWAEISAHDQTPHQLNAEHNMWAEELAHGQEVAQVQQTTKELLDSMDDPQFQYSKFMKFMKSVGDGGGAIEAGDTTGTWADEYVQGLATEDSSGLAQAWAEEHTAGPSSTTDDNLFNSKFWDRLQNEWKKMSEQEDHTDHPWLSDFNDYYDTYKEYNFSEDNPMFDVLDPLARGKEMLAKGDLPSAVLCFEAAVKKEPENAEAWQLLGVSQAENEQDPNAICALKRCIELQPDNLKALMALAVSYTNENYPRQACTALVNWMRQNPEYASLVPPGFELSGDQLKEVEGIYIRAAQKRPQNVDYEVQCGLGVLFNISNEYDKAVDCFRAALNVQPEDARLWNRLGATLANASRSEEAVDAYHRALNIEPGFIRARYNVGITCINLSAYKEAAEHFLMALNVQSRGKDLTNSPGQSQMSESIWSTLRMCISLMNRTDLRPAVDARDLDTLNRAFDIHD
ncbi:peroxisomal targeting signal 1 receptor isoform X3 [Atheta coriaria]|uniref:peroxisomal targeting signal 1 receptor isoform X3 n=1 Tax=Dalotia coriaria TaxID=877792 RepID=UPI0031F3971D